MVVERYHDISCGHRVVGHENKCRHLHGHNYRIHFTVAEINDELDTVGRVLDFGVVKDKLCMWVENFWDHKFIIWEEDPLYNDFVKLVPNDIVPFKYNPTAENMAKYLVEVIGPKQLTGTNTELISVKIEETRKCSVVYSK